MKKAPKDKKNKKTIDMIIMIILVALVIAMVAFTITRETANQEIILIEIYKSGGPNTSTASINHYYIYANTNIVEIRTSNSDGSNTTVSKDVSQDLINNLKNALDEYISKNPTINAGFNINERYTIEYNGASIIIPNPSVAELLGYDSNKYNFYNTVDNFINNINN